MKLKHLFVSTLPHVAFSLFDFDVWWGDFTVSIFDLTIGNWNGCLFYVYWDRTGHTSNGFDLFFVAGTVRYIKSR